MKKEVRVLHIFGKMDRGGAEMRTLDMMTELGRQQHLPKIKFDFLALSGKSGELDPTIQKLGGTTYPLGLNLGFKSKFLRLLRENRYDAVHSHVQFFSGYLLKLAHQEGIPVRIAHFHTTGDARIHLRRRLQNRLMVRWLRLHATDLIPVSQGAADSIIQNAPQLRNDPRVRLIYDAVDIRNLTLSPKAINLRDELQVEESAKLMIHVGRLDPVKNHEKILKVFSQILARETSAHLVLVGAAEPTRRLKLIRLADDLGIASRTHFLGVRSDVSDLLLAADLMIFPSLFEGLPGAVLEASALGLPVLCSDLPGCRELAHYFKPIEWMSLSESDQNWASRALQLLKNGRPSPTEALKVLESSPFNLDGALKLWRALWSQL